MRNAKVQRIIDDILRGIEDGMYADGTRLPASATFRKTYKASSETIAEAFEVLSKQGKLTVVKGRGTFVTVKLGVPKTTYEQALDVIVEKIEKGVLVIGNHMAHAHVFAAEYGLQTKAVYRAYITLTTLGYLVRSGRGLKINAATSTVAPEYRAPVLHALEFIRQRLLDETWAEGELVAHLIEISRKADVSVDIVRTSLELLEAQGVVVPTRDCRFKVTPKSHWPSDF